MGGRDDEAAVGQMRGHEMQKGVLRGAVERRDRLVEEPQGAVRDEEPGEGDAPPLPGRQIGDRQRGGMSQADRVEGFARRQTRLAEEVADEAEVLRRREGRFQGIAVADGMEMLGEAVFAETVGRDRPGIRPEAAGEERQQRGLAGPVPSGDDERFAGRQGERQIREDEAARAAAGKILDDDPHRPATLAQSVFPAKWKPVRHRKRSFQNGAHADRKPGPTLRNALRALQNGSKPCSGAVGNDL